jgi:membrane associated rhomboid family serine protease
MIPLRDTVPGRHAPVLTLALIAVNAALFGLELALPPEQVRWALAHLTLVPERVTGVGGAAPAEAGWAIGGLVTSQFLHASPLHLLGNMWTLWIFGDNVEDRMGPLRFALFYLLCGVAAGLAHTLIEPRSDVPTLGASGAIAGVMGAYFVLYPTARILFLVPLPFYPLLAELPALVYLAAWLGLQALGGLAAHQAGGSAAGGVAFWAHFGGFLFGAVAFFPFLSRRRRPDGGGSRS